jgi:hypothetical protein
MQADVETAESSFATAWRIAAMPLTANATI